jgi:nucleoside-diphosphate-sugar epimerase
LKKILVAGGAGYVGSVLVEKLISYNYNVEVVDCLWFGNYLPKNTKVYNKDILSLKQKDVEGFDVVIFLGGLSNDPMANYSPSMNFVENGSAPSYLAFISKKAGIRRFIYASTCSVYGYTANNLMDEKSETMPDFPYGISKLSAEKTIMNLKDKNFRPICLRKGTVGGYSPRMRFDLVVNTMVKCAIQDGTITVNNPSIWRPLIDVRDVATAYVRAIESNLEICGIYNILYDNYTIGRLAEELKDELKNHGINTSIVVRNIEDFRNYKVFNDKAKHELDFVAKYSPRESASEIIENINIEKIDFDDEKYYNIKTFMKNF